jgi:uncharacterized protein YqeY
MSLKDQITEDMKTAMRAKETERLGTIRLLLAAIKQREVDERIVVDDAGIVAIIEKLMKQRKDSITQFDKAGRMDLVNQETYELNILQAYMPAQLAPDEISAIVSKTIADLGANAPRIWVR